MSWCHRHALAFDSSDFDSDAARVVSILKKGTRANLEIFVDCFFRASPVSVIIDDQAPFIEALALRLKKLFLCDRAQVRDILPRGRCHSGECVEQMNGPLSRRSPENIRRDDGVASSPYAALDEVTGYSPMRDMEAGHQCCVEALNADHGQLIRHDELNDLAVLG
jgi:hypothetical protein